MSMFRDLLYRLLHHCAFCVAMMWSGNAMAFSPDTYASKSVLASGNWVKVSVESTGIHFIPLADLYYSGFNDLAKVGVYGYG